MARNQTVDTKERNHFILELFRANPEIESSEVQEKVKWKFATSVSARVVNQLREQARSEAEASAPEPLFEPEPEVPVEQPAEPPKPAAAPKRSAKGAKLKHVFVEAQKDQLELLEQVVGQLQEAGVANLRIDHATEHWMVFAVEGK